MEQTTQIFIKQNKLGSIQKTSTLHLMIEDFREVEQFTKNGIVSKKVPFLDDDSVWWISILKKPNICAVDIKVFLQTNDNPWKSQTWSYFVSGTLNGVEIKKYSEVLRSVPIKSKESSSTFDLYYTEESFLDLKLTMTISRTRSAENLQKIIDTTSQYKKILSNNKCILSSTKYSDFIFHVQGKQFKVHKNILAAASPVFDKLFSTKETSKENRCDVKDIESAIFQYLLTFIYCGGLPEKIHEGNTARQLFQAARCYEIGELINICKSVEHYKLTVPNAQDIYNWAYTYELEDVKKDAWSIIKFEILEIYSSMKPPSPDAVASLIAKKEEKTKLLMNYRAAAGRLESDLKEMTMVLEDNH